MGRRVAAVLIAALLFAWVPSAARADDGDAIRTMLGLASLPNAQQRDFYVGTLPKGMLFVPQPTGLTLIGSVAATSGGKTTNETIYYAAAPGSIPDLQGYQRQLNDQGWSTWGGGIASIPFQMGTLTAFPRTFCKAANPTITVHVDQQYLVVSATALPGVCASPASALSRRTAAMAKAPYPEFAPPEGSTFVGVAKQTFNGSAHVASIGLVSTSPAGTLLAALAKQMSDAGWTARAAAGPADDSQAFTIRDSSGIDWVAALSVVPVANGMYFFTAAAFKLSETSSHSVAAR